MKDLVLENKNGVVVVSSRMIAEHFDKEHKHVLDSIDALIEGVAEKSAVLFFETKYQHEQNKQWYREFLMNRDGFTLLAMGFTGTKALEWKLKYIEAFNKMEQSLNDPYAHLSPEVKAIFQLDGKVLEVSARVDKLENTMTIDYAQQENLQNLANERVVCVLGGKSGPAYKLLSKKAFKEFWRAYKRYFSVNSYKNTAVVDYAVGVEFVQNWQPSEELALMIRGANVEVTV